MAYRLIGSDGREYLSDIPGEFGGNKSSKVYGRLDCSIALKYITKGMYIKNRVFFANEQDAISAGYKPCARCMPEAFKKWNREQAK